MKVECTAPCNSPIMHSHGVADLFPRDANPSLGGELGIRKAKLEVTDRVRGGGGGGQGDGVLS